MIDVKDIFGSFRSLMSIRNGNPNARLSCLIYEALSLKFGTNGQFAWQIVNLLFQEYRIEVFLF